MSDLRDLMPDLISEEAAVRSLELLIYARDGEQESFVAAALVHLDCGHVRPTNVWFEPGEQLACVLCGPAAVTALELIAPTEFPTVDSLADLKGPE